MKNNNKFLTRSVTRVVKSCFLSTVFVINLFIPQMTVQANHSLATEQNVNEEYVFNTNSDTEVNGYKIKKFEYLNTSIVNSDEQLLKNTINEEITNRIDVCKTNTAVTTTTNNITDVVTELTATKQQKEEEERIRIAKEKAEAIEMQLCSSTAQNVPNGTKGCRSEFKSYMAYTAVTSKNSAQYKLLNSESAYTDPKTGLRMVDGRYCIAVGTGYCSKIGTKIDLVLENGNIIKCILGDVKADCHTDKTNRFHQVDGSVAEFIVDNSIYQNKCDRSGTVNWIDGFEGKILKVVVINE